MSVDRTGLVVGRDAIVPDDLEHQDGCTVGDRAVVGAGCVLGHRVSIGPSATVLPPPAPDGGEPAALLVRDDVSIGAGAVVCGAAVIGVAARVEPGAIVTRDVPPNAIVAGNPARVVGYVAPSGIDSVPNPIIRVDPPGDVGSKDLIGGASVKRFPEIHDVRGALTFCEVGDLLPFEVKRAFLTYDVPTTSTRGEHAHRTLHEFLVCVAGSLRLSLTDGVDRCELVLSAPSVGVHIPPFVWSTQYEYERSTVLLVLCSEVYDPASYIRDYDEFMAAVR